MATGARMVHRARGGRRSADAVGAAGSWRVRLAAAALLLLCATSLYGLTTNEAFELDPAFVSVAGLRYTDGEAVAAAMGLQPGERANLFRLRTAEMAAAIRAFPGVRTASVHAVLPARLRVTITEREPVMAWRNDGGAFLVDVEGRLFAPAPTAGVDLPAVEDLRASAAEPGVGGQLADLDLQVARLLGAVKPSDLGSSATALSLSISDEEGWVMAADGWRAIFGPYTAQLRPVSTIEAQLACLRDLLATGEDAMGQVTLSVATDSCGTFQARPSPSRRP